MYPLQLLLPLLDLLIVTLGLPVLPLLGPAAPGPGLGPGLGVPGRKSRFGLLRITSIHNIYIGMDHVQRIGGPLITPGHAWS